MNKCRNGSVYFLTQAAVIAGLYAALTLIQNLILPYSATLAVQVRVSEALTVLCVFMPSAVPGVTLGCLISNITSLKAMPFDLIFGTAATLISSVLMYRLREKRIKGIPVLSLLMPVVLNAVIIGLELCFFVPGDGRSFLLSFLIQGGFIAAGEIISVFILGLPLMKAVEKRNIF